jgi:hypothetical protein
MEYGWPRKSGPAAIANLRRCARGMKGPPPSAVCNDSCNKNTPCLVRAAGVEELHEWIVPETWAGGRVGFAKALARVSRHELEPSKRALMVTLLQQGRLALRVTGPMSDGFWVRVTVLLAHARFARAAGLPVSVAYRSPEDNYDDGGPLDGFQQWFEGAINADWPSQDLVGMTCVSSAALWGGVAPRISANSSTTHTSDLPSGAYAWRWSDAVEQRRWRRDVASALQLRPRARFYAAAREFWRAHRVWRSEQQLQPPRWPQFTAAASLHLDLPERPVLGVHLRGTDRFCTVEVSDYLPLIRAFLCRWPHAAIFAASDDQRMIDGLHAALNGANATQATVDGRPGSPAPTPPLGDPWSRKASMVAPGIRLLTSHAIRGRSPRQGIKSLNPGVHARRFAHEPTLHSGFTTNETAASRARELGTNALLDTILLSQTDFLLGSVSAMTSYAILFGNADLHERSFIFDLSGQPLPEWRNACLDESASHVP